MNKHDGRSWADMARFCRNPPFGDAVIDQQINRLLNEDGKLPSQTGMSWMSSPEQMRESINAVLPDTEINTHLVNHPDEDGEDKDAPVGWKATVAGVSVEGAHTENLAMAEAFCLLMSNDSPNEDDEERARIGRLRDLDPVNRVTLPRPEVAVHKTQIANSGGVVDDIENPKVQPTEDEKSAEGEEHDDETEHNEDGKPVRKAKKD